MQRGCATEKGEADGTGRGRRACQRGATRYLREVTISKLRLDGQRVLTAIVRDVTERPSQFAFLHAQGCDVMQGHLVSRALLADEVTLFLRDGWRLDEGRAA